MLFFLEECGYIFKPLKGETAVLEIESALVLDYRADSRIISSYTKDNKIKFSITIDSDKKYGVYHIDILVKECEDKDKIKVHKYGEKNNLLSSIVAL